MNTIVSTLFYQAYMSIAAMFFVGSVALALFTSLWRHVHGKDPATYRLYKRGWWWGRFGSVRVLPEDATVTFPGISMLCLDEHGAPRTLARGAVVVDMIIVASVAPFIVECAVCFKFTIKNIDIFLGTSGVQNSPTCDFDVLKKLVERMAVDYIGSKEFKGINPSTLRYWSGEILKKLKPVVDEQFGINMKEFIADATLSTVKIPISNEKALAAVATHL